MLARKECERRRSRHGLRHLASAQDDYGRAEGSRQRNAYDHNADEVDKFRDLLPRNERKGEGTDTRKTVVATTTSSVVREGTADVLGSRHLHLRSETDALMT